WKRPLPYDVHSPFAGDIDGDGCIEIMVGTLDPDAQGYRIFALDDPGNAQGCGPVDMMEDAPERGLEFRALGNGLYLFLSSDAMVSLRLYDVGGKMILDLYDGLLSKGGHTFIPGVKPGGIYLGVLRYQGGIKTAKLIIR
ncbi:MAG: hypothetical protein ABIM88_06730, partial [candidate division WOR-3 bacterium]